MNVVGKVGTLISRGVYSVATPFHPFGGAVDIIVVEQQDGTFRSTPWYVRFGKFQGVLKGAEQMVRISVNGVEANFHMCLDNSGEAYFTREIESISIEGNNQDLKYSDTLPTEEDEDILVENNAESDALEYQDVDTPTMYHSLSVSQNTSLEFHDNKSQPSPSGSPHYGTYYYESLGHVGDLVKSQQVSSSEVVLVSGDGHVLLAPISSADGDTNNLQLNTPLFELCPGEGEEEVIEQMETSSKSGINGLLVKIDENVCSDGVRSDDYCPGSTVTDGDDSDSLSSISLSNGKLKIFSEGKDRDESSVHCSVDGLKPSLKRSDVFKSCLEFSELTSEFEAENMQKDGSPVGLKSDGRTFDELGDLQSSFMTRSSVQEGDPHISEQSLFVSISCDSNNVEHDANWNIDKNSSVDRRTESDVLQNVSLVEDHDELKEVDEKLRPSGDCQEPALIEADETNAHQTGVSRKPGLGFEISLCGNMIHAGMGAEYANEAFNAHIINEEKFKASRVEIVKNENLIVRYRDRYFTWKKSASIVLGMAAFGLDLDPESEDAIPVEKVDKEEIVEVSNSGLSSTPRSSWIFWPNPFRRTKPLQQTGSDISNSEDFADTESYSSCPEAGPADPYIKSPKKQVVRTNLPSSEQIASLNLMHGQNKIAFIFSTRVLGEQKVDAHIYLWKWNARIVISDVDGTITKSDVLGQFMPLFGKDWSQSGVARLFSAIEENGYQLLFLSARAIVQAYLTRSFLRNLKQDGEALPSGPVVISPDGLFPSLYREVIVRRPHEFKIACLEDIRALFPSDYNPFYAGFGNRETDEISYRKVGIPKGKIFIINPKGEVAVHRWIDAKSYTSLHTLVDDMFPPTSLLESEDYNSWNYWKVALPNIDE